jgi:hypothetical protein
MTSGWGSAYVVLGLGFAAALVARDLMQPLLVLSAFGLIDRFLRPELWAGTTE